MSAIILGKETTQFSKSLIKFGRKTLIDIQLDWLVKNEIKEITLTTSESVLLEYKPFTNFDPRNCNISFQPEDEFEDLGTAGAVREWSKKLTDDYIYVLNLDCLAFYNIKPLYNLCNPCSILLGKPRSTWGEVELNGETLTLFDEKPILNRYVSLGHYIFHKPLIQTFPEKGSLEKDVLPNLAKWGLVKGYRYNGEWYTFNNYEEYMLVKKRLEVNRKR